jgi:DNA invertase Pin-like site-specific DNA recombinase
MFIEKTEAGLAKNSTGKPHTKKSLIPLYKDPPKPTGRIRVAAYCRVSTDRPDQEGSFELQQQYFRKLYEDSENEELTGIYADQGVSGTSAEARSEFQRLLTDCRKGLIDRVVCKSLSRFSRNIRDCLSTLRELKLLGISVYFEKENLDTAELSDEIMLTVLEGLAQEESASISRNTRWSLTRRMKEGTLKVARVPYGYRKDNAGNLMIDEEPAEVVRRIFRLYLSGLGARRIAKTLNDEGIPSPTGKSWGNVTILKILSQEKYIGDIRWQKTRSTFMGDKWQVNRGDTESFYIENAHPAIIDRETFQKASELRDQVHKSMKPPNMRDHPLRSKLTCTCGRTVILHKSTAGDYWKCSRATDLVSPCSARKVKDADILLAWDRFYSKLKSNASETFLPVFLNEENLLPDPEDLRKAIYQKRYNLRKLCLEKKITPQELAEREAELDHETDCLEASLKQQAIAAKKEAETIRTIDRAISNMTKEEFLETMVETITIDQGTAAFHLKGGLIIPEMIRSS